MCRGLLFLLERRFETFLNVTLFKQIIQDVWMENLTENIVVCLIRAGMVFAMPFLEFGKFLFRKETSEETLQHQWKTKQVNKN